MGAIQLPAHNNKSKIKKQTAPGSGAVVVDSEVLVCGKRRERYCWDGAPWAGAAGVLVAGASVAGAGAGAGAVAGVPVAGWSCTGVP